MKCLKRRPELDEIPAIMRMIDTVKTSEKLPTPQNDFEKRVMAQINENRGSGFSPGRTMYGIAITLGLIVIGMMVFHYSRPAENSYIIPLQDIEPIMEAKKHPMIDVKDAEIIKPLLSTMQNKSPMTSQAKSPQIETDLEVSYDVKAHIGMELVEVLDETIKAIERGDQEWEIEI